MVKKDSYTTDNIKNVDEIEHIRMRTRVYLGEDARDTAAREITDNAFDEITKGYGSRVDVVLNPDHSITVTDDGRGLPVDMKDGENGIVLTLGHARSGSNFDDDTTASGTNGIGASATNAISSRMDVTVWRDGKEYHQQFREGRPVLFTGKDFDPQADFKESYGKLTGKKVKHPNGTSVRFIFDPTVLPEDSFHIDDFITRVNATARLIEGASLTVKDERGDTARAEDDEQNDESTDSRDLSCEFSGPWGVSEVLRYMSVEELIGDISDVSGEVIFEKGGKESSARYRIAFVPNSSTNEVFAFTNGVYNPDGGSHVTAVNRVIGEVMGEKVKSLRTLKLKKAEEKPKANDFTSRASIVIAIDSPGVSFVGQDKRAIRAVTMTNAIRKDAETPLVKWANDKGNKNIVEAWAKEALAKAREDVGAELAKERARKETSTKRMGENMSMPSGLLPCRQKGVGSGAILFIVEGESAATAVKAARDANVHAIYGIRGKILNTYNMSVPRALENNEISDIATIIGAGIGDKCDPSKSRYDAIVFLTDADPDGMNIQSLLTIMARELYPAMLEEGMFYYGNPPLFVVKNDKETIYCLDEDERDAAVKKLGKKNLRISREKGLGETTADDLYDTIMNPDSSIFTRIGPPDDEFAYGFEEIFGKNTDDRREWIKYVRTTLSIEDISE